MDHLRKLGIERIKDFTSDFDLIVDKYRMIADATGYKGELAFKKEKGKMVIFVALEDKGD